MTLNETKKKYDNWASGTRLGIGIQGISLFATIFHFNFIYFYVAISTFVGICGYMTWRWMNKYHEQLWGECKEEKKTELLKRLDFGDE